MDNTLEKRYSEMSKAEMFRLSDEELDNAYNKEINDTIRFNAWDECNGTFSVKMYRTIDGYTTQECIADGLNEKDADDLADMLDRVKINLWMVSILLHSNMKN